MSIGPSGRLFCWIRVLYSPVVFPVEYGFIPQTWFDDNDPLDIMVLSYEPLEVGCIVKASVIGALVLEDEEGVDPKILSVPMGDPRFSECADLADIASHRLKEIQEFFEIYKRLEPKKWVKINGWENAKEAHKIVNYAIAMYEKKGRKASSQLYLDHSACASIRLVCQELPDGGDPKPHALLRLFSQFFDQFLAFHGQFVLTICVAVCIFHLALHDVCSLQQVQIFFMFPQVFWLLSQPRSKDATSSLSQSEE